MKFIYILRKNVLLINYMKFHPDQDLLVEIIITLLVVFCIEVVLYDVFENMYVGLFKIMR
jgi:hypothetical protein